MCPQGKTIHPRTHCRLVYIRYCRSACDRGARSVGQRAKVIVERMILLHYDDDVVDILQAVLGEGFLRTGRTNEQKKSAHRSNRCFLQSEPPGLFFPEGGALSIAGEYCDCIVTIR